MPNLKTADEDDGTAAQATDLLRASRPGTGNVYLTLQYVAAFVWSVWGALINAGAGKTTPVDADALSLMDSAASNATKKVTWANLKATLKTYFDTLYAAAGSGGSVATDTLWDAAGDLAVGTGANTAAKLSMGTALQQVRVNSGGTALEYFTPTTPVLIQIACSDESTALTAGTGKVTFRAPYAFTLTGVRASVNTAPTGGTLLTVDINETGTTVLSTKLTFDASEKTTTTAATAAVISDSAIADDAEISIDIDTVGSTIAGAGLKVTLLGTKP